MIEAMRMAVTVMAMRMRGVRIGFVDRQLREQPSKGDADDGDDDDDDDDEDEGDEDDDWLGAAERGGRGGGIPS